MLLMHFYKAAAAAAWCVFSSQCAPAVPHVTCLYTVTCVYWTACSLSQAQMNRTLSHFEIFKYPNTTCHTIKITLSLEHSDYCEVCEDTVISWDAHETTLWKENGSTVWEKLLYACSCKSRDPGFLQPPWDCQATRRLKCWLVSY